MDESVPGFMGWLATPGGNVPRIGTRLALSDHIGVCKARWGIGRMDYRVPAGLYAIGLPGKDAPVIVTANYKMSYDIVRRALAGRDAWLLVLETFGINVWCAAGKGTFGTDELVRRVEATGLAGVVCHRRLILPLLGAPGVAAHEVRRQSGFDVSYGPVRAEDLPAYLDNGLEATEEMRSLRFSLYDRLVLIPVEIVLGCTSLPVIAILIFAFAALSSGTSVAITILLAWLGAVLTGLVVAPLLLPWLPGRSFALKGALAGMVWTICYYIFAGGPDWSWQVKIAAILALPPVSAFYALNFTGCTNFTSRSGVKREMRFGIPVMGFAVILAVLLLVGRLL